MSRAIEFLGKVNNRIIDLEPSNNGMNEILK